MVTGWLREAGLATSLDELSIPASGIERFVEDAMKQWTGTFNPVPLDADRLASCIDRLLEADSPADQLRRCRR